MIEGTASVRCHERVARTDIDTVALTHTLSPWSPWSRGLQIMARIKPYVLLQQRKKKKIPSHISVTIVILCSLIIVVMVFFLFSTYIHWTHRFVGILFVGFKTCYFDKLGSRGTGITIKNQNMLKGTGITIKNQNMLGIIN
ncbi:uncharacterized protein LOC114262123 [Camellia sinensis]|uniref:uncharacterized protein LOC114262123 n=1 Tax=Camellia sinensis TaxID=4442 RepID=UPI001036E70B|nr:uncharacterized protein LOC114262123 [Camellia sinensis]